jgi:putative membrane protein
LAVAPAAAAAHAGQAPQPHDFWSAWTFAPAVLLGIAVSAWLYARGLCAFLARGGRGRVVATWRAVCFGAGLLTLFIALVSPVDALGSALFAAHMGQHLLLMMVAAPLLAAGDPLLVMLWAMPLEWRRGVGGAWRSADAPRALWRIVRRPPVAWTLHVASLWLWHLPALYDRALRDERIHVLEHTTFLLTALLFWWVVVHPRGRRAGVGQATLYLFTAAVQSTILGAMITFARRPWYYSHYGTTTAWGLTPLEDQQLAGLLMWIPGGVVYLAVLLPLLARMLSHSRPATTKSWLLAE